MSSLIEVAFPGASLPPPQFERFPYLRFELGGELAPWYRLPGLSFRFDLPARLSRRRLRVEQAVFRAAALFEEAFPSGHRGYLDAYLWPESDLAHRADAETQLRGLLPDAASPGVGLSEVADFWGHGEGNVEPVMRLTAPLELRQLDYRTLFRLIAHDELGLEPAQGARVYLVDETDPLVFLMYDDRGAIIHAPAVERLRRLYESAGGWLVDHDRPAIDPLFAGLR